MTSADRLALIYRNSWRDVLTVLHLSLLGFSPEGSMTPLSPGFPQQCLIILKAECLKYHVIPSVVFATAVTSKGRDLTP